jgi:predicted acylesterase/phospholipase RssA/CRP-like cAMP-binding protein
MPSLDLRYSDPRLLLQGAPSFITPTPATATPATAAAGTGDQSASPFSTANFPQPPDDEPILPDPDSDPVEKLLSSAKLFAVMELEASRKLYHLCNVVTLAPFEQLFSAGDLSDSGVYIVTGGTLGTYLDNRKEGGNYQQRQQSDGAYGGSIKTSKHSVHISTLTFSNSIGDVDVLDGAPRSVRACATESGCRLLQIDRNLFLKTVIENPRVLQSYLNSSVARLWRVGHFTLRDFLHLPLEPLSPLPGGSLHKSTAGADKGDSPPGAEENGRNVVNTNTKAGTLTGEQAFTLAEAVLSPPVGAAADAHSAAPAPPAASISVVKENTNKKMKRRVSFSDEKMPSLFDESAVDDRIINKLYGSLPPPPAPAPPPALAPPSAGPASPFSTLPVMVHTHYASLDAGWDVLRPEESCLEPTTFALLSKNNAGRSFFLTSWTVLMELDEPVDEFFILLNGSLVIKRHVPGKKRTETALVAPGSLIGGGSFLTSTNSRAKAWAVGEGCLVVAIGQEHIDALISEAEDAMRERDSATILSATPTRVGGTEEEDDTESVASMHTATESGLESRSASQQSIQSMVSACSTQSGTATTTTTTNNNYNSPGAVVTDLLLAAARALGPTIRQFISLGLTREWYCAGEVVYRAGQPADSLYIIISGRARLLHVSTSPLGSAGASVSGAPAVEFCVQDDVGRGDSMGAVWTISGGRHDTTCLCARDVEAVRMSKASFELLAASRPKAAARVLQGMAERLAAANSSRKVATGYAGSSGGSSSSSSNGIASGAGKGGEIATIAILPAGTPPHRPVSCLKKADNEGKDQRDAISELAEALRAQLESSFGPTSLLDFATIQRMFPTESKHLDVSFFRSKVTTWLNQQEEDCRFIILQGDSSAADSERGRATNSSTFTSSTSVWNKICADQADCIILAATASTTDPAISFEEDTLVWKAIQTAAHRLQREFSTTISGQQQQGQDRQPEILSAFASQASNTDFGDSAFLEALQYGVHSSGANASAAAAAASVAASIGLGLGPSIMSLRRVELVLLHSPTSLPHNTAAWLKARPHLTRHHHVRLSRPESVARLGRWMAGAAVGVVLSGGGSRGLAHVGILRALHDAGVPIDVVGGTSQGAMMAALYAQDCGWPRLQKAVRRYASEMGSARRLAGDLTLPLLSVFKGAALDELVQEAFTPGPHRIEDLWLRYFCVTTNLTTGAPSIHQHGVLWRAVRASMTLIGLVPPVVDESGQLLCDGGYSDNLPVASMRDQVGASGTVIVVDVEDRDQSAWDNLSQTDGGISGWQLLWDRWCPVKKWKYGIKLPNHASLMNALTWMAHKQNLARLAREGQRVDLYLRPPVTKYRLMDYHLEDRIASESNRYAFLAIAQWQRRHGGRGNVPFSAQQVVEAAEVRVSSVSEAGGGSSSSSSSSSRDRLDTTRSASSMHHHRKEEEQENDGPKQQQPEVQLNSHHRSHSVILRHSGAPSMLKRRSYSVCCMSQLQGKLGDNDEDEDTSSSSTTDDLMAPLEMLTRAAATAQPSLAANMVYQRLAPLQEMSGESIIITSPMSSCWGPGTRDSEESGKEKGGEGEEIEVCSKAETLVAAATAAADEVRPAAAAASAAAAGGASVALPKTSTAADDTIDTEEDQFAYLNEIEIEFDEDDLPF